MSTIDSNSRPPIYTPLISDGSHKRTETDGSELISNGKAKKTRLTEQGSITSLYPNLLAMIFAFSDVSSKHSLSLTAKALHKVSMMPAAWHPEFTLASLPDTDPLTPVIKKGCVIKIGSP